MGTQPGQNLPILVWIYGGGFVQGSNRDPEFNTSWLVQTPIQIDRPTIVISINYRLSVFGFLNSDETQRQGVSNIAFRDQWKALEWVQG